MGRPRKLGDRHPNGKLKRKGNDPRLETAAVRIRRFGVTVAQSVSPLAGYLAGVMYLRGDITAHDLGRFHAFCQVVPVHAKAIVYGVRVSGGAMIRTPRVNRTYRALIDALGRDISVLHDLAGDRLTVPIPRLKRILRSVPLTPGAMAFIRVTETQHPPSRLRSSRAQVQPCA